MKKYGAQERTRTSTPLRELAPEASASANSATWALDNEGLKTTQEIAPTKLPPRNGSTAPPHDGSNAQAVRDEP